MEIVIILLLIMLNGVFSLSEMAIVSSRKARLENLAEEGSAGAAAALRLIASPNQFLSTVQIGITLIGILAGAFGGTSVAGALAEQFKLDPQQILLMIIVLTTYLSLVIGELVPKRIALKNPEQIAVLIARPMLLLSKLAGPLAWLLSKSTDLLLRLIGIKDAPEVAVTESEILSMIREGITVGVFEETEEDMIEAVFRLDNQRARGLVTPRTEITWLDIEDSNAAIYEKISSNIFSAYPVCRGDIDKVEGIVRTHTLAVQLLSGVPINLKAMLEKPLLIPETLSAAQVLHQFKTSGAPVALVIGEYGGIEGLISLTDILEEIVGEIDSDEPEAIQRSDGSWLLDGRLTMHRLEDVLGDLPLPEDESGAYDTLAGFVLARLGHIPTATESFTWENYHFEVVDMDGHRIDKVLVQKLPDDGQH